MRHSRDPCFGSRLGPLLSSFCAQIQTQVRIRRWKHKTIDGIFSETQLQAYTTYGNEERCQTVRPAQRPSLKAQADDWKEPRSPGGLTTRVTDRRRGRPHKKTRFLMDSLRQDNYTLQLQRGHQTQRAMGGVKCTLTPVWHQANENRVTQTAGGATEKKRKKDI